jgi:tRNA(fMet)-specific endonuclease VapC
VQPPYSLDTDIVGYLLRRRMPALQSRFERIAPEAVATSTAVQAEALYGLASKPGAVRLRFAVEAFFCNVPCLAWDAAAARRYGVLRAQ